MLHEKHGYVDVNGHYEMNNYMFAVLCFGSTFQLFLYVN